MWGVKRRHILILFVFVSAIIYNLLSSLSILHEISNATEPNVQSSQNFDKLQLWFKDNVSISESNNDTNNKQNQDDDTAVLYSSIHEGNDSDEDQILNNLVAADNTKTKDRNDDDDMCAKWNLKSSSTSHIWSQHLKEIFFASRHDRDNESEFIWHDFTALLLNYMSPERLQTSIQSLPSRYWKQVGQVMKLAWDRYQYLQQQNQMETNTPPITDGPRKVNILVMGGSVTLGVVCHENPVSKTSRFTRRDCAWSTRLSMFLRNLFGDIVNVHLNALGGTNTESAITIWDYSLFAKDIPIDQIDVIIHAYSTNDMHVLSEEDAKRRSITLEEFIFNVNQKFVRTVLQHPSIKDRCPYHRTATPLLLYYDDYIGNEQKVILKSHSFGKAAKTLADYYGFGLISYANTVRDLVYANTKEDWFSPNSWPERQVHPHMGMHISSVWVIAFNLLNLATTYCSTTPSSHMVGSKTYIAKGGLPELKDKVKILAGEPNNEKEGLPFLDILSSLPPELNANTTLDNISILWESSASRNKNNANGTLFNASSCNHTHLAGKNIKYSSPCLFAWVAGLERKFDKPKHLEERMKTVMISNNGWKASNDNGKLGFLATKQHANFEMRLRSDNNNIIQTLNFMVMTSYGEKWFGSKVRVDVLTQRQNMNALIPINQTMEILGYHNRNTSETYNYKMDLQEERIRPNEILHVIITLIEGSTFKFMGMAICDH